jgi:hypothetical protein
MKNIFSLRYHVWKSFARFATQDKFYNEVDSQTSKNLRGQAGESSAVGSLHCDLSCGEPLSFFNPKTLKMQDKRNTPNMAATAIEANDTRKVLSNELTPDRVVSNFLFCDQPEAIQETLNNWFVSFVSTVLPDMGPDAHVHHANHYLWLSNLIAECGQIQNRRVS